MHIHVLDMQKLRGRMTQKQFFLFEYEDTKNASLSCIPFYKDMIEE